MGLLSRMMPLGMGMMPQQPFQGAASAFNGVDPSLAAYGQTQMGTLAPMTQAPTDAAAAAYNPTAGFNPQSMMSMGTGIMQASQPQFAPPPPPGLPNVYRNRRQMY